MTSALGWAATAAFSASYFARRPAALRWIQAGAACLWIVYAVSIHAMPVVAANLIVAAAAVATAARKRPLIGPQGGDGVGTGGAAGRGIAGQGGSEYSHRAYTD